MTSPSRCTHPPSLTKNEMTPNMTLGTSVRAVCHMDSAKCVCTILMEFSAWSPESIILSHEASSYTHQIRVKYEGVKTTQSCCDILR